MTNKLAKDGLNCHLFVMKSARDYLELNNIQGALKIKLRFDS